MQSCEPRVLSLPDALCASILLHLQGKGQHVQGCNSLVLALSTKIACAIFARFDEAVLPVQALRRICDLCRTR